MKIQTQCKYVGAFAEASSQIKELIKAAKVVDSWQKLSKMPTAREADKFVVKVKALNATMHLTPDSVLPSAMFKMC